MAITKKPTTQNKNTGNIEITEDEIDSLIRKGGSVASSSIYNEETNSTPKIKLVQLRLPEPILMEIDSIRNRYKGHPKPSRHSWIMSAILSKIESEK